MAISGSLKELTIAGQSFNVAADTNFSAQLSGFENSRIKHSGGSMKKMIGQIRNIENVVVIVNGNERSALKNLSEATDDFIISFVEASGDNYQGLGSINLEPWENEENRLPITLQPADDWTALLS
jgi:hypothetical protein